MSVSGFSTALIVIARNEERCIGRCLTSAAPYVDELLLLDTGSTDRTIDIAQEAGARVVHFQWIDDFAAARNAALDTVDTSWRIILDADEWFDDSAMVLRELRGMEPTFVGTLNVCSLLDADTNTGLPLQTSDWLSRVLPPKVRYAGRIHENPVNPQTMQMAD
jgi:glycosyltransferase involved in cell wall biosynthesis